MHRTGRVEKVLIDWLHKQSSKNKNSKIQNICGEYYCPGVKEDIFRVSKIRIMLQLKNLSF